MRASGWMLVSTVCLGACRSDADLCVETAARLAARDERCLIEGTSPEHYERALGGSFCRETEVVRDPVALMETCWPAIDESPCVTYWVLPEACDDQF